MASDKTRTTLSAEESEELLKEKSLWQLYALTWRFPFPYKSILSTSSLGVIFFLLGISGDFTNAKILNLIGQILKLGFSFSSTTLGFLIAGFTVFATLTDQKLFVKIAKIQSPVAEINWLKYMFAIFMHTFFHFSSFLSVTIAITIFSSFNNMFIVIYNNKYFSITNFEEYFNSLVLAILSAWLIYLTILLSKFIFNIYHACMLAITAEGESITSDEK